MEPIRTDRKHPLPPPLGEVAERSEDGEGILDCNTLSVTFGDSSPKGGAKGVCRYAPFAVLRPRSKAAGRFSALGFLKNFFARQNKCLP